MSWTHDICLIEKSESEVLVHSKLPTPSALKLQVAQTRTGFVVSRRKMDRTTFTILLFTHSSFSPLFISSSCSAFDHWFRLLGFLRCLLRREPRSFLFISKIFAGRPFGFGITLDRRDEKTSFILRSWCSLTRSKPALSSPIHSAS